MKIGHFDFENTKDVFIIAELSANHNGSLETALQTIHAAKRTGANAIKLQTYTPDTITLDSNNEDFLIQGTIWNGRKLHELYKEAFTPWEWHKALIDEANSLGLICFSSPFDKSAVDFLETLEVPAYKIASFEITDIPLIEYVASKGKPIIMSTGIATEDDILLAIETCHKVGNYNIAILKCTSSYPAPIDEANLCMINDFSKRFGVISGLSDHTIGSIVPVVATCLGARIIEKHFILDHSIGGPDASFSMDEKEFTEMVQSVRTATQAIGNVTYALTAKQMEGRNFSRSLYVCEDVEPGDIVSDINVRSIRPGYGLHPKYLPELIGKSFTKAVKKGSRVELNMFE